MTEKTEQIHIIATGGTIDKVYCPASQINVLREKSILPDFLKQQANIDVSGNFDQLMMIDSRDMNDSHRQVILDSVINQPAKRIVITHGTDTMVDTAKYLRDNIELLDNYTIIFTGSVIPVDGFSNTDAGFNMGFAIACAKTLPTGIYICMNGEIFDPAKSQKNIEKSRFEFKDAS